MAVTGIVMWEKMMSKQEIKMSTHYDWIDEFEHHTVAEVVEKLAEFPSDAVLDTWHDYESVYGNICTVRLETDEEEQARELKESQEEEASERRREEVKQQHETSVQTLVERLRRANAKTLAFAIEHASHPAIHTLAHMFESAEMFEAEGKVKDAEDVRKLMSDVMGDGGE